MPTLKSLSEDVKDRLTQAGIEEAEFDTRLLITETLDISDIDYALEKDRVISDEQVGILLPLVERRASREPISQIFGEKEFWSLPFKVTKDTLTPRPDSETLIETALKFYGDKDEALSILDLGTGTGCLLLALLHEYPNAKGVGIDISEATLNVAIENAESLSLSKRANFQLGKWSSGLSQNISFDIIVSNPPYIGSYEKSSLPPEVKDHEPEIALFSGEDGLDDYRTIAAEVGNHLKDSGCVILEIGHTQAKAVKKIFTSAGFNKSTVFQDLGARDRCLVIEKV